MITKYENNIVRLINNNNSTNYKFAFEQSTNYNYRESYYIKEEMLDTLPLSTLEQHKANKLSDTDRVYFNKSSSIPRYKLKEYLDQTKLKLNKDEITKWFKDNGDYTHNLNYNLDENSVIMDLGGYTGVWAQQMIEKYNPNV